jgi:hypothetical protein
MERGKIGVIELRFPLLVEQVNQARLDCGHHGPIGYKSTATEVADHKRVSRAERKGKREEEDERKRVEYAVGKRQKTQSAMLTKV